MAAHLALRYPLEDLGTLFTGPVRLNLPRPERTASGLRGEVIHIDHFGNIATNIRTEDLLDIRPDGEQVTISLGGVIIRGMVNTFGERPPGALIALFGSTGNLIVSVVNGSAAEQLQVGLGERVEVIVEVPDQG